MAASALGGLALGLAQGIKLRSDLDDAEARRNLAQEQNERERARASREESLFGYTLKDLERKDNQARSADDALRELQGTLLGNETTPASAQAIATPVGAASPTQPASVGIAATGASASAGVPAATPAGNPFVTNLSGKDLDVAYDRQARALQKYYVAKGEVKEAMQVPKMMQDLRDFNWSNKVGASLASMAGGAPGAREAFAKVYGVVNDGYDLDPNSGQFDPKKGWTGLVRVNKESGERETFNMSPDQAMVLANRYKNPAETIRFLLDNRQKDRQIAAQEEAAKAATMKGIAALDNAATNRDIRRDVAATNKTTRETNNQIRLTAENSATEAKAQKYFRQAFGVGDFSVKTKDEFSELMPAAQKAYADARVKHEMSIGRANQAAALWDLNNRKLSPSFITSIMPMLEKRIQSGKGADGMDAETGLPFINVNGRKVLVQRDQ